MGKFSKDIIKTNINIWRWMFSTKVGYFIYLIIFNILFYTIGKLINPDFFTWVYFVGAVFAAIGLTLIKKDLERWV